MNCYEIKFNDFGVSYVNAVDFSEAFKKFIASGSGGIEVNVKSIIHVGEFII